MIEQRQLTLFLALAEEVHFAKAAERMHISQSALSRQIASLEESLGIRLFERTSRKVTLSEAGKVYVGHVEKILSDLDVARRAAQRVQSGFAGVVAVGYMDLAIVTFLPKIVTEFRRQHPEVEVTFTYGWSQKQKQDLDAGRIDVGFIVGEHSDREIVNAVVAEQRLVAVLPSRHPLARQDQISITDLANDPFIQGTKVEWQSLNNAVNAFCQLYGFMPSVVQEAPTRDSMFGLVAAGMGACIYTDVAFTVRRPDTVVIPIREATTPLKITAIWPRWRQSAAAFKFTEVVAKTSKAEFSSPLTNAEGTPSR